MTIQKIALQLIWFLSELDFLHYICIILFIYFFFYFSAKSLLKAKHQTILHLKSKGIVRYVIFSVHMGHKHTCKMCQYLKRIKKYIFKNSLIHFWFLKINILKDSIIIFETSTATSSLFHLKISHLTEEIHFKMPQD